MSEINRYDFFIMEDSVDENGHVNNIEYVKWMQEAAIRHSDAQGCTRSTGAVGATWVVRTHRIEYFRPAFANERVAVLTWVSNIRRVQSLRKYKIFRIDDNTLLAEGETNWIFVDLKSGKPRSIPKEVSQAFTVVPEEREPVNLDPIDCQAVSG